MELVHCTTDDGQRLDGLWYSANTAQDETVVVMHHGVGGSCHSPGFFEESVDPLIDRGIAVLRANNRGHDIVSRSTRRAGGYLGAAFEAMDDCHLDWNSWCGYAVSRGAQKVILWGHSLGAVKSILYCAAQPADQVVAAIASSPPRFSYSQFARCEDEWSAFESAFSEAARLVESGDAKRLMEVQKPTPLLISAERFVEKYGPEETYDYTRHLPQTRLPLLITVGAKEGVEQRPGLSRLAFWEASDYLPALARDHANVRFKTIPGGDHAYTGVGDSLRAAVFDFLENAELGA